MLRKKPSGELLPSAHAVEREYRVITALRETDVPVPRGHLLCEDPAIIGTPFYVMEHGEGRALRDPALPGLGNAERSAIYDDVNCGVAALHRVDYRAVGLEGYGRSGEFVPRQIDRWTQQYRASQTEPIEAMDRLIEWLPANVPPLDETRVFHGGLRFDNLIFHLTEPRVLAVLDWELSTLGHPLADLAYHALPWRLPWRVTAAQFAAWPASTMRRSGSRWKRRTCRATAGGSGAIRSTRLTGNYFSPMRCSASPRSCRES